MIHHTATVSSNTNTVSLDSIIFRSPRTPSEYIEVNVSEFADDGYFVAEIDQFGIVTQANTFNDLLKNVKEALTLAYE